MISNPPQSYLFVQDFLILLCALLYCFCYLFFTIRIAKEKFAPGPISLMFGNLAYELYYPFVVAKSTRQIIGCLVWFVLDMNLVYTALYYACPREKQRVVLIHLVSGFIGSIILLGALGRIFPDESEQLTAYWTGWLLETPFGWLLLWYLYKRDDLRGQSLELWILRVCASITAEGVFVWRYVNYPQNWSYVASWPSIFLLVIRLIPDIMYPFALAHKERQILREYKNM